MKFQFPPILLTSYVHVTDQSGALRDENLRVKYTLESIEEWLAIYASLKLVICDGSNFDFTQLVFEKFPHANIECICFENSKELAAVHGKGYGEGEIVNYAIHHSKFIKEAEFFAKCTAKLWVANFFECLNYWNGTFMCKGVFTNVFSFRETQFDYVDTRFYLSSCAFYQEHLSSAHLNVGGKTGLSLEHCFRDVIRNKNFSNVLFRVPPVIYGVGGGTGVHYKNSLKRIIKEKIRLQLVRNGRSFRNLF
jgi:hypothetical protein